MAGKGKVACGYLCGPLPNVLMAEIVEGLSALSWTESFVGDVHDKGVVVGHLYNLQAGHKGRAFAHSDCSVQVVNILDKLVATLQAHKVASHVNEKFIGSPLEDFCIHWNEGADVQAAAPKLQRQWIQAVCGSTTVLQVEVASIDCQRAALAEDIDDEVKF